jgi:copper chaperone CopZ
MESATMTTRNLQIDGMTGDVCVSKVRGALKGVPDVTTQDVKVGSATIGADQIGCNAACAAIDTAGFKARETAGKSDPNSTTRPASGSPSPVPATNRSDTRPKNSFASNPSESKAGCCNDGGQDASGNMPSKTAAATN